MSSGLTHRPNHRRVAWLFLRLLGLCFFVAFLSLGVQVVGLIGKEGLLPLGEFLSAVRDQAGRGSFWQLPTLFSLASGDGALRLGIAAGLLLSLALFLDVAPRYATAALWILYLSFVTACREFLSFQWDNLLLETAFLAIFLAPGYGMPTARAREQASDPHPLLIFLFRWLVFRLLFESGISKLLTGDPTWRDLTALSTYFETAPLPTPLGWYAQQLPLAWHRVLSALTLLFEIVAPCAIFGPRRLRAAVFVVNVGFQLATLLTANYGFFNHLSLALGLFLLDDGHLARACTRIGSTEVESAGSDARGQRGRMAVAAALALLIVPLSVIEFVGMWVPDERLPRAVRVVRERVAPFRSINRYHLFASMTLQRLEVEIEGTADGHRWEAYEFRYKPGDPRRPPPFVAPHQPRLDFQLWFLTLRGSRGVPAYFVRLLELMCAKPEQAAGFFARDPFPDAPPAALRVAVYRYRMSTRAEREREGVWWTREPMGTLGTVSCRPADSSSPPNGED